MRVVKTMVKRQDGSLLRTVVLICPTQNIHLRKHISLVISFLTIKNLNKKKNAYIYMYVCVYPVPVQNNSKNCLHPSWFLLVFLFWLVWIYCTHVYHVCMMYYSYSTSSRYSTCTCITVCTIYMYHVVVPVHYVWWYTYTHLPYRTSHFFFSLEWKKVCASN